MQQLNYEEILRLLAALKEAKWDYAQIQIGDLKLVVSNQNVDTPTRTEMVFPASGASQAGSPQSERSAVSSGAETSLSPLTVSDRLGSQDLASDAQRSVDVKAPSIGTFWRSPQPGAPPFVEVGSLVEPNQTLCIVEVMKTFIHVTSPVAGAIGRIHKQNGELVEHGDSLFTIQAVPT